MNKIHSYLVNIQWTGNKGSGTSAYAAYERSHIISVEGKMPVYSSADPSFLGDRTKYNPEELLLASISACHMLWYLHLCAKSGIVVTEYADKATAEMHENPDGSGHFASATLNPEIKVTDKSKINEAMLLHVKANEMCFIANSLNFPVMHKPIIESIN